MKMKKRMWSVVGMVLLLSIMLFGQTMSVAAKEGEAPKVDGSYLTEEESSVGTLESNPLVRGEHLMDGNSGISKAGIGRIYAYGATSANHTVDFISVIVYVDQYNEETGNWEQIDSWVAEDTNTYYISTAKTIKVDRGYYYRVHCSHFAGNEADYPYDQDISFTDGIFIN